MKYRLILMSGIFFLCAAFNQCAYARQSALPRELLFFFSPSCHDCMEAKNEILPELQDRLGGQVKIIYRDVDELENYTQLIALMEEYAPNSAFEVPVIFIDAKLFIGIGEIRQNIEGIVSAGEPGASAALPTGRVDLLERFQQIRPLAIISAGLADGINPCAFTVIVFFISFLSVQGYRRRELVSIGSAFITAVFLTYLLIGLGIFNFLYRLKGFWAASRIVNGAIGVFSIALGILTVYDIISYRRSGRTEEMVLQLPQAVKRRIQAVVGYFYRRGPGGADSERPRIWKLVLSALVTGFLVSLLEAVCTGQLYLPTIIFVLKTSELKLQAFNYLVLYNLMFIVPLGVIFVLALGGATSAQFGRFLRKHLVTVKWILAALFFGLGVFLLRR